MSRAAANSCCDTKGVVSTDDTLLLFRYLNKLSDDSLRLELKLEDQVPVCACCACVNTEKMIFCTCDFVYLLDRCHVCLIDAMCAER
jgi:hypothetical protein